MAVRLLARLALILALSACSGATADSIRPPGQTTENADGATSTAVTGGASTGRCHEEYSTEALPNRAFAFDGTVAKIIEKVDEEAHPEVGYVDATFEVHEWFTVDGPEQVVVQMMPPGIVTSAGDADYNVGSRLLVSGEPRWGGQPLDSPVAWSCGFTRTYDSDTASEWRDALAGSTG